MADPTRFYLIRHGEVEESYHRIFGGVVDMALSNLGLAHASSVASFLATTPLDAVYVSPMRRARQTAKPLLESSGLVGVTLEDLRELDFGAWTGLHWDEVLDRFGIHARDWLEAMIQDRVEGAESIAAACQRVQGCLDRIMSEQRGKRVALVCHGGVIRLILSLLLDLQPDKCACMEIDYGSITLVDVGSKYNDLKLLNLTPWRLES